jgi:tetratricopeptide (TPR) repeat protein
MRNRDFIFPIVLLTLLPTFAFAQDRDRQMEQCLGDEANLVIAGCTALIESGDETERNLAVSFFHRGRAHFRLEEYERAIQDFDEAISLRPGFLNAFFQRGDVYLAVDDYDSAIRDFTEVVTLNPEDAIAFRYRGNAHLGKMDYEAAVADFDEALRLNPDDAAATEARAAALAARE